MCVQLHSDHANPGVLTYPLILCPRLRKVGKSWNPGLVSHQQNAETDFQLLGLGVSKQINFCSNHLKKNQNYVPLKENIMNLENQEENRNARGSACHQVYLLHLSSYILVRNVKVL